LEVLESERDKYLAWGDEDGAPDDVYEAITAIKQARLAPVQEPVAWGWRYDSCGHAVVNRLAVTETPEPTLFLKNVFARGPFPLYTNLPATPAPVDEQAAFEDWLTRTRPSGDVEQVQRAWEKSDEYADLYTAAQPAPVQEPLEYWNAVEGWVKIDEVREHFDSVGCGTIYKTAGENRVPVYTTPPAAQRPWVGLTDEEVMQTMNGDWTSQFYFARAIEAKLKEKNT
jgi:hypothetical protein